MIWLFVLQWLAAFFGPEDDGEDTATAADNYVRRVRAK